MSYPIHLLTERLDGIRNEIKAYTERLNDDLVKREELIDTIAELQLHEAEINEALRRLNN